MPLIPTCGSGTSGRGSTTCLLNLPKMRAGQQHRGMNGGRISEESRAGLYEGQVACQPLIKPTHRIKVAIGREL